MDINKLIFGNGCDLFSDRCSDFNDRIDRVDRVDQIDQLVCEDLVLPSRQEWRHFVRSDPFVELRDEEFRLQYRFSKQSVLRLECEITPFLQVDERAHCLTPLQMLLITLSHLGGDEFQRTTARCVRCSTPTVANCLHRVLYALEKLKPRYVRLPNKDEENDSARQIRERFYLDKCAYGIDGVHMIFKDKPQRVLDGQDPVQFWNRKERYSINVQVIGDAFHLIRDIDVRYPGSVHDALIWNYSMAKTHLTTRDFFVAADSAYPLSELVMKPFSEPANGKERLFNRRLSQARVVMTEDIFGMWKRRFPILCNMRFTHLYAMRAVVATAVLMNFGTLEHDSIDDIIPHPDPEPDFDIEDERSTTERRTAGHAARDRIVESMLPPQTSSEHKVFHQNQV